MLYDGPLIFGVRLEIEDKISCIKDSLSGLMYPPGIDERESGTPEALFSVRVFGSYRCLSF